MQKLLVGVNGKEVPVGCYEHHSLSVQIHVRKLLRFLVINLQVDLLLVVVQLQALNQDPQLLAKYVPLVLGKYNLNFISQQLLKEGLVLLQGNGSDHLIAAEQLLNRVEKF